MQQHSMRQHAVPARMHCARNALFVWALLAVVSLAICTFVLVNVRLAADVTSVRERSAAGCQVERAVARPRIAIVTAATPDRISMYQPATNSKQCYALRHGYDFIFDTNAATSSLNPWWRKVMATKKYLPFYDWVFWMDADTLVTNYTVRLEWFLPENGADTHLVVTDHNIALNDGAFFLRNSDWSTRFLDRWLELGLEVHNRGQRWAWDDQGAFYELLLIEAHSSPGHVEYDNECSRSNRCCEYLPLQRCFNRRLEQTGSVFGDRHVPHVTFIDPRYHPVPSEPGNAWVRGGFDQYREVEFQGEVWIYGEWSKENFWHRGDFVLHSSAKSFMKAFVPDAFTDSCALALAMDVPPRRTLKLQRPPVT